MTKTITFLLATLFSIYAFAQNFEGKITYANVYKSKMQNVSDLQFTTMMGTTQEYYIKNGDYKSVTNGSLLQWQLYINNENKLYNKMANSEAVLWNDGAINADEVLKTQLNKNVILIQSYRWTQQYLLSTNMAIGLILFQNRIRFH